MAFIKALLALALMQVVAGAERKWSYHGDKGPANWYKEYATCKGNHQSPIDIKTDTAQYDSKLIKFQFTGYDVTSGFSMSLENDGHSAKVTMLDDEHPHKIAGGGLDGEYRIAQYHFHWGSENNKGSEHTFNGKAYPLELHLVHYSTKYADILKAINVTHGLAVLGVFFEIGAQDNPKFYNVFNALPNVTEEDDKQVVPVFKLADILPNNKEDFYRYDGGLTTPACFESVVWTVFKETVKISQAQMDLFRDLTEVSLAGSVEKLVNNFRPVQSLDGRVVYSSMVDTSGATSPVSVSLVIMAAAVLINLVL